MTVVAASGNGYATVDLGDLRQAIDHLRVAAFLLERAGERRQRDAG